MVVTVFWANLVDTSPAEVSTALELPNFNSLNNEIIGTFDELSLQLPFMAVVLAAAWVEVDVPSFDLDDV
jgi:hypothetical protein